MMLHVYIVIFKKNIGLYLFVFKIIHEINKIHLMLTFLGKSLKFIKFMFINH